MQLSDKDLEVSVGILASSHFLSYTFLTKNVLDYIFNMYVEYIKMKTDIKDNIQYLKLS